MEKNVVVSSKAPRPSGPYCQAVEAGSFIFLSGQVGLCPTTGELAGDAAAQTAQSLENLGGVLEAMGLDLSAVVKTTVFLTDMADLKAVNQAYAQAFGQDPPARSCVAVRELPLGALVEIEAIAVKLR